MQRSLSKNDMTQGNPLPLMVRFAIPLLIGNLLQQLYNIVDSLIVGNFLGTQALAAVGIGGYPQRVLLALFMGLGTGASIRISHHVGAKSDEGIRSAIQTANGIMLIVSIPLTVIGLLAAPSILRLMNTPADTMADAYAYVSISFLGALGLLGYNVNAGILRGLGDSRATIRFLLISTVTNIVLDLLFVGVFGLGVGGAAGATVIAMLAAWATSVLFLRKHYPQYAPKLLSLRLDKESFRDILRLGLPIGLNDAFFALGHMMLSSLVNTYGSAFAAGYNVGSKVDSLSFMPITSLTAATTAFVGQNVGAKRYGRVRQGAKIAVLVSAGWCMLIALAILPLGRLLVSLFDSNPEVIDVGFAYVVRKEPFMWIFAIMAALNAVMNGSGEVRVPVIANLVLFWCVRLPSAYLLSHFFTGYDMLLCYPISWVAGLAVSGIYYLTGRWRRHFAPEAEA